VKQAEIRKSLRKTGNFSTDLVTASRTSFRDRRRGQAGTNHITTFENRKKPAKTI